RRRTHIAGVQVAHAHHDAAVRDQGRGGEAELVGAQQGGHGDVPAGPQSAWTAIRPRRPCNSRVCWVSARPISHGEPAWVSDVSGEAPVPPSKPEIVTWSARALATPAATVPTPTSETSFTDTRALGLAFLRSWISCARSSIE